MIRQKSCGTIIYRLEKGIRKYLLLHYPEGHWDFAKGHVEKNEREEQTAIREAREETGQKNLTIMHGFRETIDYTYRSDNQLIRKSVVFFVAATREKRVRLSNEHVGCAWFSYAGAQKQLTFENAKKVIAKAEKFLQRKEENLVRKS